MQKYEELHIEKGDEFLKEERYEEAIKEYHLALEIKPNCAQALFMLGHICTQKKLYEQAIEYFDKVIPLEPTLAEAFYNRALAKEGLNLNSEAFKDIEQALCFQPDQISMLILRATINYKLKFYLDADADYAKVVKLSNGSNKEALLGTQLVKQKITECIEQIKLCDYFLNYSSTPPTLQYNLLVKKAALKFSIGYHQEVLEDYVKAIKIDPSCRIAHIGYEWTEKKLQESRRINHLRIKMEQQRSALSKPKSDFSPATSQPLLSVNTKKTLSAKKPKSFSASKEEQTRVRASTYNLKITIPSDPADRLASLVNNLNLSPRKRTR